MKRSRTTLSPPARCLNFDPMSASRGCEDQRGRPIAAFQNFPLPDSHRNPARFLFAEIEAAFGRVVEMVTETAKPFAVRTTKVLSLSSTIQGADIRRGSSAIPHDSADRASAQLLTERAGLYFIMIINRITTMTTTPNVPTRTDRNLKSFPIVQAYKLRGGFPSLALAGCAGARALSRRCRPAHAPLPCRLPRERGGRGRSRVLKRL